MRTAAAVLSLALALALGDSAFAAERVPDAHALAELRKSAQAEADRESHREVAPDSRLTATVCVPLDRFKTSFPAGTKFKAATIGQFHVFEGVYIGNPKTPEGVPPGDGALIIHPPVAHGDPDISLVTWTQHQGNDVCGGPGAGLMVPAAALATINSIGTGKDEVADPADDPKDELKL